MKKEKAKVVPVTERIWQLALPLAEILACELVDVEYVKEGGSFFLRVYIDKEPAVDLELCQRFSEALSDILDKADPIESNYYLEVSSPGVERSLKKAADFERFAGKSVLVSLYASYNGKKEYIGQLVGLIDQNIVIIVDDEEMKIPCELVSKTNLKVFF